jgi:cytochrome P450
MMPADLEGIDLTDLDRFSAGFPHDVFTRLRREAPVWFHPPTAHTPGGEGFWVLSRHADVAAAGQDASAFSSESGGARRGGGTILEDLPSGFAAGVLLNMMDDPRHRRIRRLVTPSVGPRALAAMEDELRARTDAILDAALARAECDFLVEVAAELPLQAIARLLGVPQEDRHRLFAWANATLDYEGRELGEHSEASRTAAAEMAAYGADLIADKRRRPADDILTVVALGTVDGEPLSELEVLMFFHLLIAAGSETTRNSIALGVAALVEHAAAWRALETDRGLLPSAVEEILRWASTTPYNRRTATRDVTVRGQHIHAGDKVTLWWASANRDEYVFVDPFRFDVRRTPNPHLAFGDGTHFCLGASLARLEIRVVLDALLARCARIELVRPIEWTRSNKHTGVRHMWVRMRAR